MLTAITYYIITLAVLTIAGLVRAIVDIYQSGADREREKAKWENLKSPIPEKTK